MAYLDTVARMTACALNTNLVCASCSTGLSRTATCNLLPFCLSSSSAPSLEDDDDAKGDGRLLVVGSGENASESSTISAWRTVQTSHRTESEGSCKIRGRR